MLGVTRHTLGVARQFYYAEKRVKHIQGAWHARPWVCHASSIDQKEEPSTHNGHDTPDPGRAKPVQLSREEKKEEKGWACHLGSKAWHTRPTIT
ncbi:hypothetical protein AHAS_Ahas16G0196200 [Arachis hypogaea]